MLDNWRMPVLRQLSDITSHVVHCSVGLSELIDQLQDLQGWIAIEFPIEEREPRPGRDEQLVITVPLIQAEVSQALNSGWACFTIERCPSCAGGDENCPDCRGVGLVAQMQKAIAQMIGGKR